MITHKNTTYNTNTYEQTTQVMQHENLNFAFIRRAHQLQDPACLFAQSIIIESNKEREIEKILKMLRSGHEPDMYLKPIFIQASDVAPRLLRQVDGTIVEDNLESISAYAESINIRINKIQVGTINLDFKSSVLLKAIQFSYTRQKAIEPFPDRHAKLGYAFPFLHSFCNSDVGTRLLEIMEEGSKQDCFEGKVIDKVNLCQSCNGTYLNFRETCGHCHSLDLGTENLIHHFRCAYVGPESDFKKGEHLVCPKCDKNLRHIGIDYDKPSEIYHCNDCNHLSQEAEMKAKCIDCQHEMDLPYIQTKNIRQYKLTNQGEEIALKGFPTHSALQKQNMMMQPGVVNWEVFKIMLGQERERIKVSRSESKIGWIVVDESFLKPLDRRTKQQLQEEILGIVRSYLRQVDMLSSMNIEQYAFLMPDMNVRDAELIRDAISYNLNKLLMDNFNSTRPLLDVYIQEIREEVVTPS